MTARIKVVIIGAGIAGLSLAYRLADQAEVCVLEMEDQPGYHSSGRSASFYNLSLGTPLMRALTALSQDFYLDPPQAFFPRTLATPFPAITVARQSQRAKLKSRLQEIQKFTPQAQLIDNAQIRRLVPIMRKDPIVVDQGILDPAGMKLDSHALLHGFLNGFRSQGGQLLTGQRVTHIERLRSGWLVETDDQSHRAHILVNAAGAWADRIAAMAGVQPVGLTPLRRSIAIVPAPENQDCSAWPFVRSLAEEFYFAAESGGLLISAADESPSPPADVQPDEMDVALAVDRFESVTTASVGRITAKWAGLRCFVADRCPVVGHDAQDQRFFWLVGQGGTGLQTSPALGLVAAQWLLNKPIPERFGAQGISPETLGPRRLMPQLYGSRTS